MPGLNFNPQDWERIERDYMAWWTDELDRPMVWLETTDVLPPQKCFDFLANYPMHMTVDEIIALHEPIISSTHYYGDAFPMWWMNFGPGIAAGFLGAMVNGVTEPSETVWFSPASAVEIQNLHLCFDTENLWWKRVRDLTAAATAHWQGQVAVSMTDLGGNLDILASFRGTDGLLFDVMDQPDQVDRLVRQINRLWLRYFDELDTIIRPSCRGTTCWGNIWSTGKTYMLQSDFSYMISPAMFERFVVPDLIACCDHLDHGFYHLDGKGEIPHLDLLLSIERLRGIQWIPGDGQPTPDRWLPLLKRIRDGGKLCQIFVDPEGARRVVKNLGGHGFLLVIQPKIGDFNHPEDANAFLKVLAEDDLTR